MIANLRVVRSEIEDKRGCNDSVLPVASYNLQAQDVSYKITDLLGENWPIPGIFDKKN
jgi:hypothetical protein